jgi:hypothetical protein
LFLYVLEEGCDHPLSLNVGLSDTVVPTAKEESGHCAGLVLKFSHRQDRRYGIGNTIR